MKKLILMAVVLLSSIGAFAQHEVGTITLQPRIGINIANMTDAHDAWKSHAGFAIGVEGEYQVSDIFSVSAGLMYSIQGYKYKNASDYDPEDYDTRADYDYEDFDEDVSDKSWSPGYLNIPILANVYVVKGLAVKAGVQPGFMVSKDKAKNVKTFDFSIPVGLSYEYSNFVLDARYNIGVTKVPEHYGKSKNSVFQITLGYKFEL